jgi:Lactate racemase N-terminal domain
MDILSALLNDIPIPKVVRIRQNFAAAALHDPAGTLHQALLQPGAMANIRKGQQVAVAVGSRGIANLADLTRATIEAIQAAGAHPFIVPSMGSHGGATAAGQIEVLAHLGITEETIGAPIRSSMEVVQIGQLDNGLPVYVDRFAYHADAIVVINRVKPHTAFRGKVESGVMKMLAIGLGKQKGAEACHQLGFKYMAENIPLMARMMLKLLPVAFGVAIVENAYDQTCLVEVIQPDKIEEREQELQMQAKAQLPKILFNQVDVLVIDYIGKNISGDGMDPNVTGRYPTPYAHGGPDVGKMVVLDLTPETKGNANGIGTADFTTQRLVDQIDLPVMYANGLTSTVCEPTKIATTLANDRLAIQAAVKTCNILDFSTCRLVRIRDTLHLGEIEISVHLLEEALNHPDIEILTEPCELEFDENGSLLTVQQGGKGK